jgi:branched-chain amino acid transport system permease protein
MEYLIHILFLISVYAALGISLNLVFGYTGLLSLTHAAFFGVGSYATAILTTQLNISWMLSVFVGGVVTAILAFIMSSILSHFKEDDYALVSMSFNIIIYNIFLN